MPDASDRKRFEDVPTAPWEIDTPAVRRARTGRRVLLILLAAFILAGATGFLGARTSSASASSGGYDLTVFYPAISRPGLAIRWIVVIRHPGGFSGPVKVATTSNYFNLFDFNNLDPTPSESVTDGSRSIWTFDPPSGDTLKVTMDARIEPARQHGSAAVTSVLVSGVPVVSVGYRTRVMP